MEKYVLAADVNVFGAQVKTFPEGIGEAFGALMQQIPDGKNRAYYGLGKMDDKGSILYWADAEEKAPGEAEKYGYERYIIPQGDYLTVTIKDWRNNLSCIKDVFNEMMQDIRTDNTKPCIEWYKTDDELLCMMQVDKTKELFAAVNNVSDELNELLLPLNEAQINAIPFKDSWTAAQLATHITKSNNGIAQALQMEGKQAERNPEEKVKELKDTFLDFSIKMKSPPFIVPEVQHYNKAAMMAALNKSASHFKENAGKADLHEMINLPAAFGEITKLELLYFVVYHTQRHIHQLKNIIKHI